MRKKMILPIAIDLGAKNTGVFSAVYHHGTDVAQVDSKMGKVYELTKDSYTLLMDSRTAKRHQRRGLDRKQLVKRLFKLIWTEQLNLEWHDYTQQTLSFLLNRRGFSFLEEKHDAELLKHFPNDAISYLPQTLATDNTDNRDYDLNAKILELLEDDSFAEVYSEIESNIKEVKREMVIASTIALINSAIETRISANTIEITKANKLDKLERVSNWIVEFLISQNANINKLIVEEKSYSCDLLSYISLLEDDELYSLKQSLPLFNEKALKVSVWNFNISNFNLDSDANIKKLEEGDVKTHIHHLAFALHNIKKELDEGSRHRSKYFEEVASVLLTTNHQEQYLKNFCQNLHNCKYANLTVKKLINLIGNISNLELKPLRKYFNDKGHIEADYWNEKSFAETYCRWVLGEWRVGSKDKDKQPNAKYDYKSLCNDIKQKVGTTKNIQHSVVNFMLDLDPCRTIPPYQDNNNRKPPKCQSLILNSNFLDNNYPNWQSNLVSLKKLDSIQGYLETFEQDLRDLKTGKQASYFVEQKNTNKQIASGQRDYKDLDAKVLQFIFDRVKATDDLLLNEIYSLAKKVKQNASTNSEKTEYASKLLKAIDNSNLPNSLKSKHKLCKHFDKLSELDSAIYDKLNDSDVFEQGTFLHLVCRYFKYRQRAKDSRLYIMPEYSYDKKLDKWNNTGRFDDSGELLTYCNHKPRQKRYQLLNDLAGALQVSPTQLMKSVEDRLRQAQSSSSLSEVEMMKKSQDEQILEWLKTFRIGGYCKTAVEMQKQYRGTLKLAIDKARFREKIESIRKNKKSTDDEKIILEKYNNTKAPTVDETKLVKLVDNIEKSATKIAESLGLELAHAEKFNSIFSFAQIQQIVFAERSGNASTCAVCSVDNAHRMQQTKLAEHSRSELQSNSVVTSTGSVTLDRVSTKAQRLPAISTRVIDGAVKKMATILARNIVDDNWGNVKQALENNEKLSIPIITESNAFEFEPNLADIKGTKKKDTTTKEELFAKKENRIKAFAKGRSAYSGKPLNENTELDHIIPRSSKKYGTLNDEANLICVSRDDNQNRGNTVYSLSNLANNYKQLQFGTTDSQEIESWIAKTIWDDKKQDFKFGNYRSFINLTADEQKAFRHALFLVDDNPIRQAVIKAINNRNRAFVNGTQRYFAEVLANNFYLRAKKEKLDTSKLDFDYFGVETTNTAGRGVTDVRKLYENLDKDIKAYAKGDKPQDSYSHLIDAMLAFCVAADEHKNEGSIGLKMGNKYGLFPTPNNYDTNTGEVLTWLDDDIFKQIKVTDNEFEARVLARRKATEGFNTHRQMTRDGIYAEKYLPILVHKSLDEIRKGFSWDNSEEIKIFKGKIFDKQQLINIVFSLEFAGLTTNSNNHINDVDELREILELKGVSSTDDYFYINLQIQKVHEYYVENYNTALGYKKYSNEMNFLRSIAYRTEKKNIKSIDDVKAILAKDSNFKSGKVCLPYKQEWQRLYDAWLDTSIKDDILFLRGYFGVTNQTKYHNKIRKDFSLPIKSIQGNYIFRRKSWDNRNIYQIMNNSDPRKDDVQAYVPVFDIISNQRSKGIIDAFVSDNIFMLSNDDYASCDDSNIKLLDRSKWYLVEISDDIKEIGINKIHYRVDDNSRPSIKISYKNISEDNIETLCNSALIKPNVVKDLKEQLEKVSYFEGFIYKGATFSNTTNNALNNALKAYYETFNN